MKSSFYIGAKRLQLCGDVKTTILWFREVQSFVGTSIRKTENIGCYRFQIFGFGLFQRKTTWESPLSSPFLVVRSSSPVHFCNVFHVCGGSMLLVVSARASCHLPPVAPQPCESWRVELLCSEVPPDIGTRGGYSPQPFHQATGS